MITMQNLVTVTHIVCAQVGGPENSGDAGTPPLKMGACRWPLKTRLFPACATIAYLIVLGQTVGA